MAIAFTLNGKPQSVSVPDEMPLLWVLRDTLGMTGTKFGCGLSECSACTVHVDGVATKSCSVGAVSVAGKKVTTIEGLSADRSHPVQRAWIEVDVPQCGYCQSGQIMAAASLLAKNPTPTDADIDKGMRGVICRCGTYQAVRKAIHRAAELAAGDRGARGALGVAPGPGLRPAQATVSSSNGEDPALRRTPPAEHAQGSVE